MNNNLIRHLGFVTAVSMATMVLTACGGGGGNDSPATPTLTQATIGVALMTDAPSCGFSAVNVTISKLRFNTDYNAGADASGWTELAFSPAKKINLLNLASVLSGGTVNLGDITLPAGAYKQMVVVLDPNTSNSANTVTLAGASTELSLVTSAALATGIRIPVDLNVQDGQKQNLVFDFDACEAVQPFGTTYLLKPHPRTVSSDLNGISGFVDKTALGSNVVITAQQNGAIATTTVPNPTTGEFALARLPAGKYDLVVQATGRATDVIGAVPVAATGFTNVATATAPIPLTTSATSNITGVVTYTAPAVPPDDGTWIMASQIVSANANVGNSDTTVIFRMQPVNMSTGSYTLAGLPRSAIQFAPYSTSLPLTLAPAVTSLGTGHYRVEVVATGFGNKTTSASANMNVSTGDARVNLSLP